MNKNIVIIHYNTPELTYSTIQSIRKVTPGCSFSIFDNSDIKPFKVNDFKGDITIYDNTKGNFINFEKEIQKYLLRRKTCNNHASSKHILSIQFMFNLFKEGFILVDSDVLVKKDISDLFDESVIWCGMKEQQKSFLKIRLIPYLLWINIPMCKEYKIRFVKKYQNYKLSHKGIPYYDTGASFLENCEIAKLKGKEINIYDYIIHFGGGSYKKKDYKIWLEENKFLYS